MVVLKNIKVSSSKNLSSELLVLGRFKNSNIEKLISYLSIEDKKNIMNAMSIDLSNGDAGDYVMLPGNSSFKRIMLFNLGDKNKITNDKMRAFGSNISLVDSKK